MTAYDVAEWVVLANTGSRMGPPELWNARIRTVLRDGMAPLGPAVLDRWLSPGFRERDPATVAKVKAMLEITPPQGYAGCCAALRDFDGTSLLPRITTPT